MKKSIMLTFVLAIAAGVWNWNRASDSQISSLCDTWNVLKYIDKSTYYGTDTIIPYNNWFYRTRHYYLKDDTVINSTQYTKAFYENVYIGALRENDDASKVFGIPVNQTHEYLLYDWTAQVGDTLQNFWYGDFIQEYLNVTEVVVHEITSSEPRKFTIHICGSLKQDNEDPGHYFWALGIIEGVGLSGIPIMHSYIEEGSQYTLCAYKNGEQVYTSAEGKRIGCYQDNRLITRALSGQWELYKETLSIFALTIEDEVTRDVVDEISYVFTDSTLLITCPTCYTLPLVYGIAAPGNLVVKDLFDNYFASDSTTPYSSIKIHKLTRNELEWSYREVNTENKGMTHYQYLRRYPQEPYDTIPLFIKDGPGSSTVEPVDPNLIYATLTKDVLSLYEKMDMEIDFTLYQTPQSYQMPSLKRTMKATTFSDSISTVITESGYYTIELTNPTWDYTIVGTFEYNVPQAVENTVTNTSPAATKVLRDGQLIFLYEGKTYNVQGQQIQ